MITTLHPDIFIRSYSLSSLFHSDIAIKALAAQMVAGQVEAHLDMISDAGPSEYSSFKDVADCVAGAKDGTKEYVEDLLAEFKDQLLKHIEAVTIKTTAVILKPEGDMDADITVEIE